MSVEDRAHVDIESFSELDITDVGAYCYAEHHSTFIHCVGYRFNDGPKHIWIPFDDLPADLQRRVVDLVSSWGGCAWIGTEPPADLIEWVIAGKRLAAHNAGFERVMLNGRPGRDIGFPATPIAQWLCTAAKARANGLPGSLDDVAGALGTPGKMAGGRANMLACCRPRKPSKDNPDTRLTYHTAPDKFFDLYAYNLDDVEAEYHIDEALPDLSPNERLVWERLDQVVNDRGVETDPDYCHAAIDVREQYKRELEARCLEMSGCDCPVQHSGKKRKRDKTECPGFLPSQRERVADWVRDNGWPSLTDMQAETVERLAADERVPKAARAMLQLYGTYGMKAAMKFDVILAAACADKRVRGMFVYCGAGTGRWSSILIQLQNLFRPVIKDALIAIAIIQQRCIAYLKMMYKPNAMKVIASTVRGALVAAKGMVFIAIDFAGIESRVTAWMAGEEWVLEAFKKQDTGGGPDAYEIDYANTFGCTPEEVGPDERQKGKPINLSMGFEGGVGAFVTMCKTYKVKLQDLVEGIWHRIPAAIGEAARALYHKRPKTMDERTFVALDSIKRMWRRDHPATEQLWRDMKEAAIGAVKYPGSVYVIPNKKIMFKLETYKGREWLRMRLPSGRRLSYYQPRIEYDKKDCPRCQYDPCPNEKCETEFICARCDGNKRVRRKKTPSQFSECSVCNDSGKVNDEYTCRVTYMGVDTKTRRWTRVSSYGGKWTENAVQATARDLLVASMFRVEARGLQIVMTVHDEIVLEVPVGTATLEEVEEVMCVKPRWADGLPIAAEGWVGQRYRK